MTKYASIIFKIAFALGVAFFVATDYAVGKISQTDLMYFVVGVLFLFVVIPGMFLLVYSEPHVARLRNYLENGFYKTPAGRGIMVCLVIGFVLLVWLL